MNIEFPFIDTSLTPEERLIVCIVKQAIIDLSGVGKDNVIKMQQQDAHHFLSNGYAVELLTLAGLGEDLAKAICTRILRETKHIPLKKESRYLLASRLYRSEW